MLGTVNRVLLAAAGLVLTAAGTAVLTASWPFAGRHAPLLSAARRRHWQLEGWAWWVLVAGLGLVVLLALCWLLAQVRRARPAVVLVDTGDGAFAALRGRALEEAVAAECDALDGVARSRVTLAGRRGGPALRVALRLEPYAVPADVLAGLEGPVLAHARTAAALPRLPLEARLRITDQGPRRVA
ncbi:alkaline shock response membrane anchor protein AmaP [Streptomyces venezuelae]|uniref:Alkaline shock response membrane anchor protein AmaP n=1 Tax=Streptomyces venezuelae TaxID=54571 RepID=A0A5P2D6J9_STRVZ|nr:alkaline shock response membrane anchor protein AmaP [Streptomyces venezuelae]QES50764.1 alkaline shock response membrane anchor protein AmaP [Streptomyces venezuelae]